MKSQRRIILGLNVGLTARTNVPKDEENLLAGDIVSCIYPVTVLLEILICWSNSLSLPGLHTLLQYGGNEWPYSSRDTEKKNIYSYEIYFYLV